VVRRLLREALLIKDEEADRTTRERLVCGSMTRARHDMPVARTGLRELDLRGLDDASACTALMAQACDPEHASQERIL
jgi:hypothetical protein